MPEVNLGQLSRILRAEFLVDARASPRCSGVPFRAADIEARHHCADGRSHDGKPWQTRLRRTPT